MKTALEQHRQTWKGKSDEWLFERLNNELKSKVEEIHRLLNQSEQNVGFKAADCILAVCAVPHGYQFDLLDNKAYLDDKVVVLHSECRSYAENIDLNKFTQDIVEFIRNGGQAPLNQTENK